MDQNELKTIAMKQISEIHTANTVHFFTDGSVIPDTGKTGSAAIWYYQKERFSKIARIRNHTNTLQAEMHGI
jgi:hypothetical protein